MKIKTYINNIIALVAVLTLVGGFQVTPSADNQLNDNVLSIETTFGVEEAYAGPCGRRGCDGTNTYCTTYTVLEIGGIQIVRHCDGKKHSSELQLQ